MSRVPMNYPTRANSLELHCLQFSAETAAWEGEFNHLPFYKVHSAAVDGAFLWRDAAESTERKRRFKNAVCRVRFNELHR